MKSVSRPSAPWANAGLPQEPNRLEIRHWTVIAACTLISVVGSGLFWSLEEEASHLPRVQDEFSYLLAADTYLQGRATNPSPDHWKFFESLHILQQPSYASKYPPAQGAVLAVGETLGGRPIVGAWISTGLAVGALAWLLLLCLPFRWAAGMSAVAVLQVGLITYWSQGFWGGSVATLAGALLFGSVWRSTRKPRLSDGILTGFALVLLANSRPLEGLLVVLAAAGWTVWRFLDEPPRGRSETVRRFAAPALVLGLAGLAFIGWYNQQVTGSPTRFPHQVYQEQYSADSHFFFAGPRESRPEYRHDAIRDFHVHYGLGRRNWMLQSPVNLLTNRGEKLGYLLLFYLGPAVVGLLGLLFIRWTAWLSAAGVAVCSVLVVVLLTMAAWPHYFAPAAGLLYLLAGAGLRAGAHRLGRPSLVLVLVIGATTASTGVNAAEILRRPADDFQRQRHRVIERLTGQPGDDLVFVRYGPGHDVLDEWVYNEANIDSAAIVWARDRGDSLNAVLARHYSERSTWLLVDDGDVSLRPYRPADRPSP